MLPDGISRNMAMSFINISVTEYSAPLVHLGVKPLTWPEFFDKHHFQNNILHHGLDTQRYHELLEVVVNRDLDISWVLVPNCKNVMCRSSLYARDELFLAGGRFWTCFPTFCFRVFSGS
jgi:hypothetical protein